MIARLERRHEPLAPRSVFLGRMALCFGATLIVVAFALAIGTIGYRLLGGLGWLDSFYNAGMILTGMGPVDRMEAASGKIFATFYALFSGIVFLTLVAILITPIYHRFLHHFHLETGHSKD